MIARIDALCKWVTAYPGQAGNASDFDKCLTCGKVTRWTDKCYKDEQI